MIDQSHMLSLLQAPRPDAPVLSLYVNLDPSHAAVLHRDLQIRVASLLDATQRTIQEPRWERLFETEKKRVQEFFADFEPTGKGFVLFSSLPQNLWVAEPTEVALRDDCSYAATLRLSQLLNVYDEREPYAVLLLDSQYADFYIVAMGAARKVADAFDYLPLKDPRNQWGSGPQALKQEKHRQALRERHFDHAAESVAELLAHWGVRRLLVGAAPRAYGALVDQLPIRSEPLTVERVQSLRPGATPTQVMNLTAALADRLERETENELVAALVARAEKGEAAVLGAEQTIESFLDHRLHALVTAAGVRIAGGYCPSCAYLSTLRTARCPRCDTPMLAEDNILEQLQQQVLRSGGVVEQVDGQAAEHLLRHEGVGALLKYGD